jgi:hypothetical protein
MKHLRKINNYNSYLALLSALDSAPIWRLEWIKQITEGLKEYCALIDFSSSFRAYRQALSETTPFFMLFTTVDISGKVVLRHQTAVCLKTTLPVKQHHHVFHTCMIL